MNKEKRGYSNVNRRVTGTSKGKKERGAFANRRISRPEMKERENLALNDGKKSIAQRGRERGGCFFRLGGKKGATMGSTIW